MNEVGEWTQDVLGAGVVAGKPTMECKEKKRMGQDEVHEEKRGIDEGRRKLIRAAALAGGTAVAVATLPGEWKKPLATVGGLPAHAQTSGGDIALRNVLINFNRAVGDSNAARKLSTY